MASDGGWVKLYRNILSDKGLWDINEPYDSRSAYMYLVLNAQYQDSVITGHYTKRAIKIQKGSQIRSLKELSQKWAWSIGKTRRFLSRLSDMGAVTLSSTPDGTLITLINYGKSDIERHSDEHGVEHTNEQDDGYEVEHDHRHDHRHEGGTHNKKDKKGKTGEDSKRNQEYAQRWNDLWGGEPE